MKDLINSLFACFASLAILLLLDNTILDEGMAHGQDHLLGFDVVDSENLF